MRKTIIVLSLGIVIGISASYFFKPFTATMSSGELSKATSGSKEKKILYWVAPMDPNFRRDKPGKSPMGMDLVPFYEDSGDNVSSASTVKIDPQVVNNLGVRTSTVEKGNLSRKISSVGYIDYDETRIAHIHLRTKGWIEKLAAKTIGQRVKKGELLFELYSPELVNAQEEYLQAFTSNNAGLIKASHERLRSLGLNGGQIDILKKTRKVSELIPFYAHHGGVVSELHVREGMHVMPETNVMTVVNLSAVWLIADVFEQQASWVEVGQTAIANLPYLPGQEFKGQVEFIYPELTPKTRSLRVRLRFDNPNERLKPNMFAHVTILGTPKADVLNIPREAVIRGGQQEHVIIAKGKGQFEARDIVSGIESGDRIEILSGLKEGESVVTSSQFLIDSESSLKASFNQMDNPNESMGSQP